VTPTGSIEVNNKPAATDAVAEKTISGATPVAEPKNEDPRKRIPLASIPATISIGLLIAAVYLGGRIVTAHRMQKSAPAIHSAIPAPPAQVQEAKAVQEPVQPAQSEAKPVVVPAQEPASKPPTVLPATDSGDEALPMIEPHPGDRYLQVGALDPDAKDTRRFVERLRNEGLDPHVAQGPTPVLMRVLIGPFTKSDALNEKKAQIESEGLDTFVRDY
jgi:cell division septation protein DedD